MTDSDLSAYDQGILDSQIEDCKAFAEINVQLKAADDFARNLSREYDGVVDDLRRWRWFGYCATVLVFALVCVIADCVLWGR